MSGFDHKLEPAGRRSIGWIRGCSADDPYAYLADVISKIFNGHPNSRIDELLPWACPAPRSLKDVA